MKYNKVVFLFYLSTLSFVSCDNDEGHFRTSEISSPPIITGFDLRTAEGSYAGVIGVPNSLTRIDDAILVAYPNPFTSHFNIDIDNIDETLRPVAIAGEEVSVALETRPTFKVWVVKGVYEGLSFEEALSDGTVVQRAEGLPLLEFETDETTIHLDMTPFEPGFYRVYLHIEEKRITLYDNVWFTK